MKNKIILVIMIVTFLFLVSCTPSVPIEKQCFSDDDCVKATCCHASDAVNKDNGPDCTGQMCTQECVPGTLDCQQGEIKCLENECVVVLNEVK